MIKGLTEGESLKSVGDIRKGAPKPEGGNRPGRDLDYFRFTSDQEEVLRAFRAEYGTEPKQIDVFLAGPTLEETSDFWMEEYVSGGITKRCDGETLHLHRDPREAEYSTEPKACEAPHCNCKETGRLFVFIPALKRLGEVCVHTTSKHDIKNLATCIRTYERLCERAGIDLSILPLILCRTPMSVSVPAENGRTRMKKHLITLEPRPDWAEIAFEQLEAQAMALPDPSVQQLPGSPNELAGRIQQAKQLTAGRSAEAEVDIEGAESDRAEKAAPVTVEPNPEAEQRAAEARREAEIDVEGAPPTFLKEVQTAASDYGFRSDERGLRLAFASRLVGYDVETFKELTAEECEYVTDALDWLCAQLPSAEQCRGFAAYAVRGEADLTGSRAVAALLDEYKGKPRPVDPDEDAGDGEDAGETSAGDGHKGEAWDRSAFDDVPEDLK